MLAEGDDTLSSRMNRLVAEMRAEWKELDAKIEMLNGEFVEMARSDAAMRRLTTIPGIGVLNATAVIAAVGVANSLGKARDLGAWLGFAPRQHTTGGKPRLLGISKRCIAVPAARRTPLGRWLKRMIERSVHRNAVVVALANKLARVAWATLRRETSFERNYPVAA